MVKFACFHFFFFKYYIGFLFNKMLNLRTKPWSLINSPMWKQSTQYKYYLADNKVIIYCLYTQLSYVLQKYNTF